MATTNEAAWLGTADLISVEPERVDCGEFGHASSGAVRASLLSLALPCGEYILLFRCWEIEMPFQVRGVSKKCSSMEVVVEPPHMVFIGMLHDVDMLVGNICDRVVEMRCKDCSEHT